MKFTLRNLGRLEEATIDLDKDLIVLTGPNNTSKTYVAHAIYGLCKGLSEKFTRVFDRRIAAILRSDSAGSSTFNIIDFADSHLAAVLAELAGMYKDELHDVFAADNEFTSPTSLSLQLEDAQRQRVMNGLLDSRMSRDDNRIRFRDSLITVTKTSGSASLSFDRMPAIAGAEATTQQKVLDGDWADTELEIVSLMISAVIEAATFQSIRSPFILPAERNAIMLFSRELAIQRTELIDDLLRRRGRTKGGNEDIVDKLQRRASLYPLAIRDSIIIANDLLALKRKKSTFSHLADRMERVVIGGAIRIEEDGDVRFQPDAGPGLTLHLASSSVKSLTGLSLFLRHIAQENDFLIIDEPELNLHPDNQRRVARVLARLARAGVKVLISTHSDYVIRELNNLIMLSADKDREVRKRHGYDEEEILAPAQVGAYLFDASRAHPIEVAPTGIEVETIDREINALNTVSQDIYFSLFDKDDA